MTSFEPHEYQGRSQTSWANRLTKMKTLRILFLAFGLFGQSCSQTDERFEMLLKSPDKFHGQEIAITGIIHDRFEDNAIYLTENGSTDEAVWIEYSEIFMMLNKFEELDGRRMTVRGEFDKGDKGHLGQYVGTLRESIVIINE